MAASGHTVSAKAVPRQLSPKLFCHVLLSPGSNLLPLSVPEVTYPPIVHPFPQDLAQVLGKSALTPALVLQPWGHRLEEGNHLTAGSASFLWHKLQRSGTVNVLIAACQKTGRRRFSHFFVSLQYSEWKWVGSCVQALVLTVCVELSS